MYIRIDLPAETRHEAAIDLARYLRMAAVREMKGVLISLQDVPADYSEFEGR